VLRLAVALVAAMLVGSAPPKTALLTHVQAEPGRVTFSFRSAPRHVTAAYVRLSRLSADPSGKPVRVTGSSALVLRFQPASGVDLSGSKPKLVYAGPARVRPSAPGAVREVVRLGDFESVLSWVIALDRTRPYHVVRNGANVVVTFG